MTNAEIASIFTDIAERLKLKKENIFKIRAYQKVARSINELQEPVAKLAAEKRLKEIPGAGEAIIKKLTELVATGKITFYEKLKAEFPERHFRSGLRCGMVQEESRLVATETVAAGDAEAISYFKEAIGSGKHWYLALLGAIGLWASAAEDYNGRSYVYLIDGEAFDWLLLAERLCETVKDLLPENEMNDLLFHGIRRWSSTPRK